MSPQTISGSMKFGVVIAAYNAAPSIGGAVASAMAAGATEVVVVDDGSTDRTAETAESAGARVLRQENAGAAQARRAGLRSIEVPWVIFLDADDVLIEEGVSASLARAAASDQPVIVGGVAVGVTPDGGKSPYHAWDRSVTVNELIRRGYAPGPPGLFLWPLEIITTAMYGPQPAVWPSHAEDFELLIRGATQVPVLTHSVPTLLYSLEGGKSAVVPTRSVVCSEEIRSHYAALLGIPYRRLSDRQIRGRAAVRSAKALAAGGDRKGWVLAIGGAAARDPAFVLSLVWHRIRSRLRDQGRRSSSSNAAR